MENDFEKCMNLLRKDKQISKILKVYKEKEHELTVLNEYLEREYSDINQRDRDKNPYYPL